MTINVKRANFVQVQLSGRCWYSIDELENFIREAKGAGFEPSDMVAVFTEPLSEFSSSLPLATLRAHKDLNE